MFRRKEDEEIATGSQNQEQNFNAVTQDTVVFNPKPASFGAFSSAPTAPAYDSVPQEKKTVTAPLTTSQVGLGANVNRPAAPSAASAFTPTYNKVPAPTAAPAPIPAAPAASISPSKLEGIEAERRLTVGYGITLTGEVSDCDRLVIYGKVNAKLQNVKFLQISDSGKFNGSAQIEQAEISGIFEGELKVLNNITITSTGRVNGKITYGSIEIRPGGKFTGEIVEDASATDANNQQPAFSSSQEPSKDYYGLSNSESASKSEAA